VSTVETRPRPPAPPASRPGSGIAARLRSRPRPALALGLIAFVSAAIHTALAWARATPNYYPDEYIYSEIGRSVAEGGLPLVRGAGPFFAPILQPVLTAPVWLIDDVATAYRLVQALDAVFMSLAVIPVYLIARRLKLSTGLSLACAALAVALPDLLYTSWVVSEPVAYPMSLAALAAGLALFERPTLRLQAAFLALAGLATLARLQLAAIALCYLLAVLVVGLRERRFRSLVREQWLGFGAPVAGLAVALAIGLKGQFGYYASFTEIQADASGALQGFGANVLILVYASGFVLVPGAALGLFLAFARPRSSAELAFGALVTSFGVALLLQAALYGDTGHMQQRYLVYALPLLVIAFALYAGRGWPLRRVYVGLAGLVAALASLVPLAGYAAADGSSQSLVLLAVRQLERTLDDVTLASLVVALAATALSLLVPLVAWARPARGTAAAIGAASIAFLALTAGAFAFDRSNSSAIRATFLAANPAWVDATGVEDVTLMLSPAGLKIDAGSTLFWNRSIDRVVLFPGAFSPDNFAAARVVADDAGRLRAGGKPVTGPLLVDIHGMSVELRDAQRLGAGPTKTLWQPRGQAQLLLAMPGLFYDGWLSAHGGGVAVWPVRPGGRLEGWFELNLDVPASGRPIRFRLDIRDGSPLLVTVRPGSGKRLRIPVCRTGIWAAAYATDQLAVSNGRRVGPHSSKPRFVADPAACSAGKPDRAQDSSS
jgi:hypothetical protein